MTRFGRQALDGDDPAMSDRDASVSSTHGHASSSSASLYERPRLHSFDTTTKQQQQPQQRPHLTIQTMTAPMPQQMREVRDGQQQAHYKSPIKPPFDFDTSTLSLDSYDTSNNNHEDTSDGNNTLTFRRLSLHNLQQQQHQDAWPSASSTSAAAPLPLPLLPPHLATSSAMYTRDVSVVFGRDIIQVPLKVNHSDNQYVNLVLSHREFDVMAVHISKYDEMPPAALVDEITERLKEQIERQKSKQTRQNSAASSFSYSNNQLGDFPDSSSSFQARILELEYELSRFKTKLAAARALQTTLTDENTVLRSNLRDLEHRCVENESLQMQNEVLRDQSVALSAENNKLKRLLGVAHEELSDLGTHVVQLRSQVQTQHHEVTKQVTQSMGTLLVNVRVREQVLQQSYVDEKKERQLIAEKYYELSGRIRVFCRLRPVTRNVHTAANSVALLRPKPNAILVDKSGKEFSFDQVFGPENSQADVYAQVEPVVVSFADGYNACIMAYGQTGSGKTYSMVGGSGESQGMIPRALQQVFMLVKARQLTYKDTLTVNMVEIYNDQILDLLTEGAKIKNETEITSRSVTLWEHVDAVLSEGNANRNIASTSMNVESSRSHALVFLHLESQHRETMEIRKSTLCLVDLAGSERISRSQVEGERLKETQHINKSLSALGDVMHALQHKAKHVPYRNSKLTYMLREMLSGQAKTLMMLQLSPEEDDLEETICSLQFGARVSQIQMGAVKTSVESGTIFKLKEENRGMEKKVSQLEDRVSLWRKESRSKLDELEEVRARNQELEAQLGLHHDPMTSLQVKFQSSLAVTPSSTTTASSMYASPPLSPRKKNSAPLSPSLSSRSVRSTQSVSSTKSAPASAPSTPSTPKRTTRTTTSGVSVSSSSAALTRASSSLARPSPRSTLLKDTGRLPTATATGTTVADRIPRRSSLTTLSFPSAAAVVAARERLTRAASTDSVNRRATLGAVGSSASQSSPSASSRSIPRSRLAGDLAAPSSTGSTNLVRPAPIRRTNSLAGSTSSSVSSSSTPAAPRASVALMPSSSLRAASALEKRRALASSRSSPSTPVGSTPTAARTRTTTTASSLSQPRTAP